MEILEVNIRSLLRIIICGPVGLAASYTSAQNLTLEGQTGGFITPTAYVVLSGPDHVWSHPAVGFHFVNASSVIGYVYTFSIEEGIANRAEFGYTRSVHTEGNSPAFSSLWDFSGMNVFNGKVVAIKDGALVVHGQGGFIEIARARPDGGRKGVAADAGVALGTVLGT